MYDSTLSISFLLMRRPTPALDDEPPERYRTCPLSYYTGSVQPGLRQSEEVKPVLLEILYYCNFGDVPFSGTSVERSCSEGGVIFTALRKYGCLRFIQVTQVPHLVVTRLSGNIIKELKLGAMFCGGSKPTYPAGSNRSGFQVRCPNRLKSVPVCHRAQYLFLFSSCSM